MSRHNREKPIEAPIPLFPCGTHHPLLEHLAGNYILPQIHFAHSRHHSSLSLARIRLIAANPSNSSELHPGRLSPTFPQIDRYFNYLPLPLSYRTTLSHRRPPQNPSSTMNGAATGKHYRLLDDLPRLGAPASVALPGEWALQ
jgi:hypothetical protein